MTKYLILITILVLLYLYWKAQQTKTLPKPDDKPDDIIERQGKQKERSPDDFNKSSETFWDAKDWEINSDNEDKDNTIFGPSSVKCPAAEFVPVTKKDSLENFIPDQKPILSRKQQRQLQKKK